MVFRTSSYVKPFGTPAEVLNDLRMCTVCVMPSRVEPFGLVGFEALAAGKPVLISSNSGLAKLMEEWQKLSGDIAAAYSEFVIVTPRTETLDDVDIERISAVLKSPDRYYWVANAVRMHLRTHERQGNALIISSEDSSKFLVRSQSVLPFVGESTLSMAPIIEPAVLQADAFFEPFILTDEAWDDFTRLDPQIKEVFFACSEDFADLLQKHELLLKDCGSLAAMAPSLKRTHGVKKGQIDQEKMDYRERVARLELIEIPALRREYDSWRKRVSDLKHETIAGVLKFLDTTKADFIILSFNVSFALLLHLENLRKLSKVDLKKYLLNRIDEEFDKFPNHMKIRQDLRNAVGELHNLWLGKESSKEIVETFNSLDKYTKFRQEWEIGSQKFLQGPLERNSTRIENYK